MRPAMDWLESPPNTSPTDFRAPPTAFVTELHMPTGNPLLLRSACLSRPEHPGALCGSGGSLIGFDQVHEHPGAAKRVGLVGHELKHGQVGGKLDVVLRGNLLWQDAQCFYHGSSTERCSCGNRLIGPIGRSGERDSLGGLWFGCYRPRRSPRGRWGRRSIGNLGERRAELVGLELLLLAVLGIWKIFQGLSRSAVSAARQLPRSGDRRGFCGRWHQHSSRVSGSSSVSAS